MKKILIPVLCFLAFIGFIIFNAWHDAHFDTILFGGHFQALIWRSIIAFLLILTSYKWGDVPFEWSTGGDFFIYGGSSWIIFDPAWNLFRGIPLNYVGVTSWFDYFFHNFDPHAFEVQLATKGVILIIGICLKIKY